MKKLFFTCVCLMFSILTNAQTINGINNYTKWQMGTLPIVISVPHGGNLTPSNIPNRTCNSPTTVTDAFTIELGNQIDSALYNKTGCHSHLIICNLKRTKLDCNRGLIDGACGNAIAENSWKEFHRYIDSAQFISNSQFAGKTLFIDLHGHGRTSQVSDLGYNLSANTLNSPGNSLNNSTNIAISSMGDLSSTSITGNNHAQIIRGANSFGTLLANSNYPCVPSSQIPYPGNNPYFTGGYSTSTHTCITNGNTVNGLQIETPSDVRNTYLGRKAFADSIANVIIEFIYIHHGVNLLSNCGLENRSIETLNSPSRVHPIPNSPRVLVYPIPIGDVLKLKLEINQLDKSCTFETILMNYAGQILIKSVNELSIDTSVLEKGIYFLNVKFSNGEVWSSKIIK